MGIESFFMAKGHTTYCGLFCGPHVKNTVTDIYFVYSVCGPHDNSLAGCVLDIHDLKTLARQWEAVFLFSIFL